MTEPVRLQRFLAQAGIASRRKCEEFITSGRVSVNGKIERTLGTKITPGKDKVRYRGEVVTPEKQTWVVLNKPDATVTTMRDPQGRTTVASLLRDSLPRIVPVGRLDYHTTGVLLLTNDGDLAAKLAHPRNTIPRTYHVKVKGLLTDTQLSKLSSGVKLGSNKRLIKCDATRLRSESKHTWIEMTIFQGINHQIHRMLEAVGGDVIKLHRVSFAGVTVTGMKAGEHRPLNPAEIGVLKTWLDDGLVKETKRDSHDADKAARKPKTTKGTPKKPPKSAARRNTPAGKSRPARKTPGKTTRSTTPGGPQKSGSKRAGPQKSARAKPQTPGRKKPQRTKKTRATQS